MIAKLLTLLVLPPSCCVLLALAALVLGKLRRPRAARATAAAALVLLWLASTPLVATRLALSVEERHLPVAVEDSPSAGAIVVLGGALGSRLPPRIETELVDPSDRVLHAARLYRAGKALKVVFTP